MITLRRSRLKVLVICTVVIALFLIYQRRSVHNHRVRRPHVPIEKEDNVMKHEDMVPIVNKPVAPAVPQSVEVLRNKAMSMNFDQEMKNVARFGMHTPDSVIFLLQVHSRPEFVQQLINSLRASTGIEHATVVISVDVDSPEINEVLARIDFCRYMVIFFPFAKVLYPNSFPGEDPNDCPKKIPKAQALERKCNNAEYPDMFGNYREVNFVQIKHHWFWKLNMAFSGIRAFKHQKAPIILLEDDYFVVPDIIHCAKQAEELRKAKCPRCQTISLGNYEETQDYQAQGNQVEIKSWISSKHNLGMVVSSDFYNKIASCAEQFCNYDDYNWDWSLQAVSPHCEMGNLFTLAFKATRVFHLGSCGVHSKGECNAKQSAESRTAQLQNQKLYPESLHIAVDSPTVVPAPRPNGGWGDLRDQTLCKRYKHLSEASNSS
ncbi:alpha-1,6-mannosyl-glycoprotein 2-beta-N-acetylglucosaminyltransferase-like [Ciona intestinalis]